MLCATIAVLGIGVSAQAQTISYTVSGWQTTCSNNALITATNTDCMIGGTRIGRITGGTINGTAQFVGNSTTGGTLTVNSSCYLTSSNPGAAPATFSIVGAWYGLSQSNDPAGLRVTGDGPGTQTCTPASSWFCMYPDTPLPVANIDIYGPGNTVGGTLTFLVQALAGAGDMRAWQEYTLTVNPEQAIPEPSAIVIFGLGALLIGTATRLKKK